MAAGKDRSTVKNRSSAPGLHRRPLSPPACMTIRVWAAWLAGIGIGALALRLIYLAELYNTPLFAVLIGDGQQYDTWARQIAGGQWIGTEVFYQTPLYPYLLAVVFKLLGHHLLAVRAIQAVLGAASCVLLGLAGRRFFDERAGLIAAALLAIHPPAIFYDGLIQKSSLDLFLVTLTLALLGAFLTRPDWRWLIAAGAAFGAFTLNRENARVVYPIIVVWLLIHFRQNPLRSRLAWAAVFTASIAAVLLPVGIRNYHVGGEFLISTSQLGPNLYIGNHAGAQGGYEALVPDHGNASYERGDATQLAEQATGRTLSAGEVSDYWFRRSVQYIRSQPLNWLPLMGRKLLLTFNAREGVDTESIEAYSDYSPLLRLLLWFGFGIILPLAVLGAWQTRGDWRRLAVLYAVVIGLALSVAVFYVLGRYRYPLVPLLMLFAAAALSAIGRPGREWRRRWIPGFLLAIAVAVVCHLPIRAGDDETYVNVSSGLIEAGAPADAVPLLQRAIEASPADAPPHFNLGVAFDRTGDKQKALEQFAAAIKLRPDYFEAQSALALALRETGQLGEALAHFREAVRLKPGSAGARANLGLALLATGQPHDAIVQFRESLRLRPDDAIVHNGLAGALQQEGQLQEAIAHYEAAVKLDPEYAEAHSNLALALRTTGNYGAAREHLREAVRIRPDNFGIRINFGDLLMEMGQTRDALEQYGQAARLSPASMDAYYRMAQGYARGGQLTEAIDNLQKALAIAQATGQQEAARQLAAAIQAGQAQMRRRTR